MAVAVYAFGTGGKRKRIFQDIYFSAEETDGVGVLYTKTGEYSAVLKIENPVQKYSSGNALRIKRTTNGNFSRRHTSVISVAAHTQTAFAT